MVLMRVFRDKAIRTALTITLLLFVKSETVADENANVCSQHYTENSGFIYSPNFPNKYPSNTKCHYLIKQRDPTKKITLSFQKFSLEAEPNCRYDSVKIYDGNSMRSPQLGQSYGYCGEELPPSLTSTGNHLLIVFISDSTRTYSGFKIAYGAVDVNIAKGKPTWQSSDYHPYSSHRRSSLAVDGNTNTDWYRNSCSQTLSQLSPWWMVDLGKEYRVDKVLITSRGDCDHCVDRIQGFEIRVGNSNYTWGRANNICKYNQTIGKGQTKTIRCDTYLSGRYVTVRLPNKRNYLTLCEVQVFARGKPGSNIALRKRTWQSSDYILYPRRGSLAVDGNKDSDLKDGSCSQTNLEYNPWWMVDLLREYPVGKVLVTSRGDCDGCVNRIQGLEVRIGNSNYEGGVRNKICKSGQTILGGTTETIRCDSPLNGRFVVIRLPNRRSQLTLCEVQVFAGTKPGSIKSPNFPKYYPHNAECYYLITQRDRLKIVLDFKQFSLESDSSCRHDSVKIYDGSSVTAPQLGEVHGYCGRHLPPSLTSTGDSLLIIFTSDRSDRYYTGFHITYRAIACNGSFTSNYGSIYSPNFPKRYTNKADCHYLITQRDPTIRIALDFKQFDLESSSTCQYDSVKIYDGNSVTAPQLGQPYGFCGYRNPPSLSSIGNSLLIVFTSNGRGRNSGFHITYRAKVCDQNYESSSGFINSPNYPNDYPTNVRCYYLIRQRDPAVRIILSFQRFSLEEHSNCKHDSVKIYDGNSIHASQLGYSNGYCGNRASLSFTSTGSNLLIVFTSDASGSSSGFSATYKVKRPTTTVRPTTPYRAVVSVNLHVYSEGCEDRTVIKEECGRARIEINGRDVSTHERGLNVVIIDYDTGLVKSARSFDTHANWLAAEHFTTYIHNAPMNSIVAIAVQDDGSRNFYSVRDAIKIIGGSRSTLGYRSSYALLGYKGNYKMKWITEVYNTRGNGPSEIRKTMQLGSTTDAIAKQTATPQDEEPGDKSGQSFRFEPLFICLGVVIFTVFICLVVRMNRKKQRTNESVPPRPTESHSINQRSADDEGIQTESDSIPLQPVMPTVAYHAPDTNWRGILNSNRIAWTKTKSDAPPSYQDAASNSATPLLSHHELPLPSAPLPPPSYQDAASNCATPILSHRELPLPSVPPPPYESVVAEGNADNA